VHAQTNFVSLDLPKLETIEIPILKLNFYMMGMDSIDQKITLGIGSNIEYLNQEFEGKVKFVLNELIMDPNGAYLPDLHKDFFTGRGQHIRSLVEPVEKKGAINVYLFDTYSADGQETALMGFTPILRAKQRAYFMNSPRFDRIFISFPSLQNKSTLVHEMGHFLGLRHPWEMNAIDRELLGLNTEKQERHNHMTYEFSVNDFTDEQLERMRDFALRFRKYLLDSVEVAFVEHN